jgi:hypothetical protein
MPKTSSIEDNIFPLAEAEKVTYGRQEDGSFRKRNGEILPPKNRTRREPYPEPEEKQVDGNEEVVETPDGSVAFMAVRMNDQEYRRARFLERKRLKCMYMVVEVYAGQPRPYYSYDELIQLRNGEMKR